MSDVTAVTSHFATANEDFSTTTTAIVVSGGTAVPLASIVGLTNATVFVGVIEPGGVKEQIFTGIVDTAGSQITGVKWTTGTNVDHASGVTVVDYDTGTSHNMMVKGLLVQHKQTGAHASVTADSVVTTGAVSVGGALSVTGAVTLPTGSVSAVSLYNPYKFSVWCNNALLLTSSTWTKVPMDTKIFDTSSNFSTVNNRFTAPITAYYQIDYQVRTSISGISVAANTQAALYVNGSAVVWSEQLIGSGDTRTIATPQIHRLLYLTAGDYVEGYAYVSEAGRNLSSGITYTWMSGFLVSAT